MRSILIFTSNRSEYGLLRPLIFELERSKFYNVKLLVTGSHLSKEHGYTVNEILGDGFEPDLSVPYMLDSSNRSAICKGLGLLSISVSDYLDKSEIDAAIILGDRVELLPFAVCCNVFKIPLIHFSGGELTFGAIDDNVRHAITKLSNFHFCATQDYSNRVVQLGENPKYVFSVGEIGLDNLQNIKLLSKAEFSAKYNFNFQTHNILVTYHPETNLPLASSLENLNVMLQTLASFDDCGIIFTSANSDFGGQQINQELKKYTENHPNARFVNSLGTQGYYSALNYFSLVLGNSSSGIVEAPSFKVPAINVGGRQAGRTRAKSTVDAGFEREELTRLIKKQLKMKFDELENPYGDGCSVPRVLKILDELDFQENSIKYFRDIPD